MPAGAQAFKTSSESNNEYCTRCQREQVNSTDVEEIKKDKIGRTGNTTNMKGFEK